MIRVMNKLKAIEEHLGDWVKVGNVLYMDVNGRYITYAGNKLSLNGTNVYLDEQGTALLINKEIKFTQIEKDVYRLTKEFKKR